MPVIKGACCFGQGNTQNEPWASLPCSTCFIEHEWTPDTPGGQPQPCRPRQESRKQNTHLSLFGVLKVVVPAGPRAQRSRTCGLQEGREGPQKPPLLPAFLTLALACPIDSQGLLTPARAMTPPHFQRRPPRLRHGRPCPWSPDKSTSALPCSTLPGAPVPKLSGCPLLSKTSREWNAFYKESENSGSWMEK